MRRKDRQVLEAARIDEIIKSCTCCRIGFIDDDQVYIVPLNFGFEKQEGTRVFYFHSAKEGRKIDLIERCSRVGFEMDTNYQLRRGEVACECSAGFQSVIGTGRIDFVDSQEEKRKGLLSIMQHNTGQSDWAFNEKMVDQVCVFKVTVTDLACKDHE